MLLYGTSHLLEITWGRLVQIPRSLFTSNDIMMLLFKLKRLIPSNVRYLSGTTVSSLRVAPRLFPTTGFSTIPASEKLEEERWPWYTPHSYYPVRIGEVLQERYQVLYKLGYGTTSTIWICRDLDRNCHVCLKSMVHDYQSVEREIKAYEVLSKHRVSKPSEGMRYIRQALDHFELRKGEYNYQFLVHEALGLNMDVLLNRNGQGFELWMVRDLAGRLLRALNSLHNAQIIHGDIQGKNILLRIQDEAVLNDWEEEEIAEPSPRKITPESIIFQTKQYVVSMDRLMGPRSIPVLCDFGEARTGKERYRGYLQPGPYRSPEVLLNLPWSTPVDIWNLGCLLWTFATNKLLFIRDSKIQPDMLNDDGVHLATMAMLLGLPPRALLEDSGARAREFFNEDGSAKYDVPYATLESRLSSALEGTEDPMTDEQQAAFVAFIRRVLIWESNKRPTASELLNDPWITDV